MLATVSGATVGGVDGHAVSVEVHSGPGLPGCTIVGLPDASCRESRDRVRAALINSGLKWPDQRTTINLAPSDLPKAGTGLDLAIAIGVLVATEQLKVDAIEDMAFIGELGLDGSIRPVPGVLPMALAIEGARDLVVAEPNAAEAELVGRFRVRPVSDLSRLMDVLNDGSPWPPKRDEPTASTRFVVPDLADVRGQPLARRALEVAAAGGHHMLMIGPPGGGKTMLAQRLPGLLGELDDAAALRATVVHSAAGQRLPPGGLLQYPPFRAPHHTASLPAVIGGGSHSIRPGEISLASDGVLFLDEFGEYPPSVLEALRVPLEEGVIRISRSHAQAELPARFLLVAAMNPCPCGMAPSPLCQCTMAQLARYARRVSGPILDRLDLRVQVTPPSRVELFDSPPGEPTAAVAERVSRVRQRALARGWVCNAAATSHDLEEFSILATDGRRLLERALDGGRLSGRGMTRLRAVALTLDDLRGGDGLLDAEVFAETLALRAEVRFDAAVVGA